MPALKAHYKYAKYLFRHKWYVFLECCRFGMPFRGLMHDSSKFSLKEWPQYVRYFYGEDGNGSPGINSTPEFDAAWNHHQKVNPHHWQYWVLLEDDGPIKTLEMPKVYAKEMVADWVGVARSWGNNARSTWEWYEKNKDIMRLHPNTRAFVEAILLGRMIEDEYKEVKEIGLL